MDKDFKEKCIDKGNAVPFQSTVESEKRVKQHNNNSDYFLKAAQNILKTDTPNVAVMLGFFAMEHNANALIAKKGYDIKSHICTPIFLSRELNLKDLATRFNKAVDLRKSYNYMLDLKIDRIKEVEDFINSEVVSFIEEIDKLTEEED